MEKLIEFLKREINDELSLEEIVRVFEQMCDMPVGCDIPAEDDMILFETGTFSFTDEPLFYFSLVRQFPNDDEEYFQVHVDVLYEPTAENAEFSETTWSDEFDANREIFDHIRKSPAFASCKNQKYVKIEVFMDET